MSDVPARRLDRAQLERVLLRAAELQATERELADDLTPDEVVALAKEVGIPEAHVRRALAESRAAPLETTPPTALDSLVGRAQFAAARTVPGEPADVQRALLDFVQRHEALAVQRQTPGRVVWERLGGLSGALKRGSAALDGSRTIMLDKAAEVSAEIVAAERGWSHVVLRADAAKERTSFIAGASALPVVGVVGGMILTVMHAPLLLAALPVAGMTGLSAVVARSYRPIATRLQLGLERALDHLEHRGPDAAPRGGRDGLLDTLVSEVRRAIR